jgi:hypothetical protein
MSYDILLMKHISGTINLTDRYYFSTFFYNKKFIKKIDVKMVSFTRVFPIHDFGNRQIYKITNTGVDGQYPYFKIKNIAFEQK